MILSLDVVGMVIAHVVHLRGGDNLAFRGLGCMLAFIPDRLYIVMHLYLSRRLAAPYYIATLWAPKGAK